MKRIFVALGFTDLQLHQAIKKTDSYENIST